MSVLNTPTLLATIYDVDLKTTGQTTLYTISSVGYCVITEIYLIVTAADAATLGPGVTVGKTASWDDWSGASALSLTSLNAVNEYASLSYFLASPIRNMYTNGDVVKLDVRTGATATSLRATAQIFGYYVAIPA